MVDDRVYTTLLTFVTWDCVADMKKLFELSKILVVHLEEGSIEGILCDCILDLNTLEVMGWSFKKEGFFSEDAFVWAQDIRIGKEVAFIRNISEKPAEFDQWHCWGKKIRKNPIIDRTGKDFGHVRDILLREDCALVEGIELENRQFIECSDDVSIRNTVVVISPTITIHEEISSDDESSWWGRLLGKDS